MKNYKTITCEGKRVATSSVRGLQLLLRRGAKLGDTFIATCPNGNTHYWSVTSSAFNTVGYAPRKKSARVGKGTRYNFKFKLIKVLCN